MTGKRKDNNHAEIVAALESCGALCLDMTGDPKIGFDLLVVHRALKHICEIKDGTGKKLTPNEAKRKSDIESKGAVYNVIDSVEDALRMIGAIR
jgi:hypothetical protein